MRQTPRPPNWFTLVLPYFLIITIDVMGMNITGPIFAYAVQHPQLPIFGLHKSLQQRHDLFGWLKAITPLCNMLGTIVLGYYSDHMGRKKILVFSVCGTVCGLGLYIISFTIASYMLSFVASVIVGFTAGSAAVAQAAMADISSPSTKINNISIIALALTLGFVLSSGLGGVLADKTLVSWFNNRIPLYFASALSAINVALTLLLLKETHPRQQMPFPALTQHSLNLLKIFYQLICKSQIFFILLTFFFFELGWGMYFNSISLTLVQAFHATQSLAGLFPSYVGIVMSLGLIYGIRLLTQHLTLANLATPCLFVGILALAAGFAIPSLWVQWTIALPIAVIVAITYCSLIAMASNQVDSQLQGALMSVTDALLAGAFMIDGLIIGKTTTYNAMWPQLTSLLFLSLALVLYPLAKSQYQNAQHNQKRADMQKSIY